MSYRIIVEISNKVYRLKCAKLKNKYVQKNITKTVMCIPTFNVLVNDKVLVRYQNKKGKFGLVEVED